MEYRKRPRRKELDQGGQKRKRGDGKVEYSVMTTPKLKKRGKTSHIPSKQTETDRQTDKQTGGQHPRLKHSKKQNKKCLQTQTGSLYAHLEQALDVTN